jgi:hypothetical protein
VAIEQGHKGKAQGQDEVWGIALIMISQVMQTLNKVEDLVFGEVVGETEAVAAGGIVQMQDSGRAAGEVDLILSLTLRIKILVP